MRYWYGWILAEVTYQYNGQLVSEKIFNRMDKFEKRELKKARLKAEDPHECV